MNINLNYYDACFKICVLSTILNSQQKNDVIINDNLVAKTECIFNIGDMFASFDRSEFKVTFVRNGQRLDVVTFDNDFKKALHCQRNLWDENATIELKLQAMKTLSPSILAKFLKSKPLLTASEMLGVISKAKEMEAAVLEQSEVKNRHI